MNKYHKFHLAIVVKPNILIRKKDLQIHQFQIFQKKIKNNYNNKTHQLKSVIKYRKNKKIVKSVRVLIHKVRARVKTLKVREILQRNLFLKNKKKMMKRGKIQI